MLLSFFFLNFSDCAVVQPKIIDNVRGEQVDISKCFRFQG